MSQPTHITCPTCDGDGLSPSDPICCPDCEESGRLIDYPDSPDLSRPSAEPAGFVLCHTNGNLLGEPRYFCEPSDYDSPDMEDSPSLRLAWVLRNPAHQVANLLSRLLPSDRELFLKRKYEVYPLFVGPLPVDVMSLKPEPERAGAGS